MSPDKEDELLRKYRRMGMTWLEAIAKIDRIKRNEEF